MSDMFFRGEHGDNLPTVRIQKITVENFKSVKFGEVVFSCGKQFVPYGTKSDILGIYGQNGSGKTSLMEAMSILKLAMCGIQIPDTYAECISKGADFATLTFVFDLQYKDGRIRKVVYKLSLAAKSYTTDALAGMIDSNTESETQMRVEVFNEILSMSGDFEGGKKPLKPVIDTSTGTDVFEPKTKLKVFVKDDAIEELKYLRRFAKDKSMSFIFSNETFDKFYQSGYYSEYFQVLIELKYYATVYLYVASSKMLGLIRSSLSLPLYNRKGIAMLDIGKPQMLTDTMYQHISECIEQNNTVLSQLVPLLNIKLKVLSDVITKDGKPGKLVELIASRDGVEMPFRYESDGIKKIVSILNLVIAVFNDRSVTVAIDEIDAGVYEYLLGEILKMVQDSGKGQLMFTSHNLRPLEVLNKECICFTTTNPENRYIRLKGVGATNNLRDTYIREILMNSQDEELYKKTKRYKTLDSFIKATNLLNYTNLNENNLE